MKRILAILLSAIVAAGVLSACNININLGPQGEGATGGIIEIESGDNTVEPQIETEPEPEPEPETESQFPIGTLDDYVRVYREVTRTFGDGNKNTLRLPEIMINGEDVYAANDEIVDTFGEILNSDSTGAYALDYEAYLNDTILSVVIVAKYDGGNTYGLAYDFDVTTGDGVNNVTLCSMTGREYNTVIADLQDVLADYYNEKYSTLPGNDSEKKKTLSSDNINAATLYLGSSGKVMALCDIYAAVGGGHWIAQLEIE